MVINLPDDTHDSTTASQGFIYEQLEQDYLIKFSQHDTTSADAYSMLQNKEATPVRQMSEWGMSRFQ
eukprot:13133319-Ditylum_brightwellii.AAC.1